MEQIPLSLLQVNNITVIQDNVQPGGTKARILPTYLKNKLTDNIKKVTYAGPRVGFAQVALAITCQKLGLRCGLYVSGKGSNTNVNLAKKYGANILGYYLTNKLAKDAAKAAVNSSIYNCEFGFDSEEFTSLGISILSELVKNNEYLNTIQDTEFHLFIAYGTGTISRILRQVFPNAVLHCVQVGRQVYDDVPSNSIVHKAQEYFTQEAILKPPYNSSPYYDAKVYKIAMDFKKENLNLNVVIWNVV